VISAVYKVRETLAKIPPLSGASLTASLVRQHVYLGGLSAGPAAAIPIASEVSIVLGNGYPGIMEADGIYKMRPPC
jgi:hypothetical protein